MRLFTNSLGQSTPFVFQDVATPVEILTPLIDVTSKYFYWFRPYLAADFPEITCDKTYFFLWGTDHDPLGVGGCWWGKGNNLDGSDFEEISSTPIVTGYQAETPYIMRIPNIDGKVICFYYHTIQADPQNTNGIQETRALITTGGLLHSATWTDIGNPLGFNTGESHTGYMKGYKIADEDYKASHTIKQNLAPNTLGEIGLSSSVDGRTWTRYAVFDRTTFAGTERAIIPSFGGFFDYDGRKWLLCTTMPQTGFGQAATDKQLVLFKADSDFQVTELVAVLNNNTFDYTWDIYIEGNTAYCYLNRNTNPMKYTTFNLSQLVNL